MGHDVGEMFAELRLNILTARAAYENRNKHELGVQVSLINERVLRLQGFGLPHTEICRTVGLEDGELKEWQELNEKIDMSEAYDLIIAQQEGD
jgi:hypothetical protein